MNMTDDKLEEIKQLFDKFDSVEQFIEQYIKVYNPKNPEIILQLFDQTRSNSDAWEFIKFMRSKETLRLDKKYIQNVTIEDIIKDVKEYDLSKYKRIMIKLDNKNYEDIDKLLDLGIDIVIIVSGDKGMCTIDEFKKMRNFFNFFADKCSTYNLSYLEKIALAYDYVKFFSFNDVVDDRLTGSRSIVKSINSGNIVCEGYSRIFCQLLSEMGIHSNLVFIKPNSKEEGGHVRVIVKIDDKKYGISDVFAFDPTWDANHDTFLVSHSDGTTGYEIESMLKQEDTVIEKMPSEIRYLFFMVPLDEYSKYFPGEQIEKIQKYPSGEPIELVDYLMDVLNYNDGKPRSHFIFDFISDLLYKTKKVEGYDNEQIESYIHSAIEILNQDRYGRYDKKRPLV